MMPSFQNPLEVAQVGYLVTHGFISSCLPT